MTEDAMQRFLERYGHALSSGDLPGIMACWEVPALVLSDQGELAVSEMGEIEQFFTEAVQWYRSQGIVATKPQIERIEALTDRLAAVSVRWPSLDAAGTERASERTYYIVRTGDDGQPRICVALTRTVTTH